MLNNLQAYRKLDDMATKQTETLRKLTKQVSDFLKSDLKNMGLHWVRDGRVCTVCSTTEIK